MRDGWRDRGKEGSSLRRGGEPSRYRGMAGLAGRGAGGMGWTVDAGIGGWESQEEYRNLGISNNLDE